MKISNGYKRKGLLNAKVAGGRRPIFARLPVLEVATILTFLLQCLIGCYLVGGLFFFASGIADRLFNGAAMSVRWCGMMVVGMWIASVGFHLLALIGILTVWGAVAGVSFLAVLVRASGHSVTAATESVICDAARVKRFLSSATTPLEKALLAMLGIAALLVCARTLLLPPLAWDSLTYHAVKAGMWVQNGHCRLMEAPGGWFNYRTYPGGAELFHAFAMLTFEGDFLVPFVDFVQWLALIPALFLLGRCIGLERKTSLVGSLCCAFLPPVVFMVGSCYVDLIHGLAMILGVAFVSKYFFLYRSAYLVLGLMSLGIAGSVRYFAFIPICGILVLVVGHISIRGKQKMRAFAILCLGLILMLVPLVPWPLQTMHDTGYLFFPFSVKLAGLQLGLSSPATDWFIQRHNIQPYALKTEATALLQLFYWHGTDQDPWPAPKYGVIGLLGCCVFPVAMISLLKRRLWIALLIGAVVVSVMAAYFLPGFALVRQLWAKSNARFLFPAILPAVVVGLLVVRGHVEKVMLPLLLLASGLTFLLGVRMFWKPFEFDSMAVSCILLGIGAGTTIGLYKWSARPAYVLTGILVLFVCLTGLYHLRSQIRLQNIYSSYFFHDFPRYWTCAVARIDDPNTRRKIAVTSGPIQNADNWFMYLFMGRRLQNTIQYVPVTENGEIEHFGPNYSGLKSFSYESWLRRLHQQGITEVMSFSPTSVEIQWMLDHPESFQQITGDGQYGLFRVKGSRAQPF